MSTRSTIGAVVYFLSYALGLADSFPVVGATYQLDRAQFPGQLAICATEKAMIKYFTAKAMNDQATTQKMLMNVDTMKDFARLKAREGCTLISSFSQAKVVEKGKGAHRAQFFAFPFEPMWGVAVYFGHRVN